MSVFFHCVLSVEADWSCFLTLLFPFRFLLLFIFLSRWTVTPPHIVLGLVCPFPVPEKNVLLCFRRRRTLLSNVLYFLQHAILSMAFVPLYAEPKGLYFHKTRKRRAIECATEQCLVCASKTDAVLKRLMCCLVWWRGW